MPYGTTLDVKMGRQRYKHTLGNGNVHQDVTYPANYITSRTTITRSGQNTPRFGSTSKAKLPENSFNLTVQRLSYSTGWWTRYDGYTRDILLYQGAFGETNSYSPSNSPDTATIATTRRASDAELTAVDAVARNKIRLKLKDQKVNIAQMIAERQQALNMIRDTVMKLAESMRALKAGQIAAAAEHLGIKTPLSNRTRKKFKGAYRRERSKAVANGWLQLQYGWLPLLSDVKGLAEQFAQIVSEEIRGYAAASHKWETEGSFGDKSLTHPYLPYVNSYKSKYVVKYTIHYAVDLKAASEITKVGLTNPLLVAWELVPYSFIVDWFWPLGNALSSLDATSGLRFLKGSKTTFYKRQGTRQTVARNVSPNRDYWYSADFGSMAEGIEVTRTPLMDFPYAAMPQFKNPLSVDHLLNALALLTQTFKR